MRLFRDTCRSIRDLIPLHAGRDLDPGAARRVDEHLHACLGCFREYRELATMRGRLGVLAEQPLPDGVLDDFTEQVMARIAMGEEGPAAELPGVRRRIVLPVRPSAAAASLLVALSLGLTAGMRWSTRTAELEGPASLAEAAGVLADGWSFGPGDAGFVDDTRPRSPPSLGVPVGDFQRAWPRRPGQGVTPVGGGAATEDRRGPSLHIVVRPMHEPGMPSISTRDLQLLKAFPQSVLPLLLPVSANGLVPDTDPARELRLRHPDPRGDG